jgi:large subunit ribosomal protein L15
MSMIHEVTSRARRTKPPKRKGRGESSYGKTSGRGTKGAKARVGKYIKRGYEGGQTTIFRRLPKRGFSNENFERRFYIVNLQDLERFADGAVVDAAALLDAGLLPDRKLPVKILGDGKLSKKLTVSADKFSKSAVEKLTAAGGAAQNADGQPFTFPKPKKVFVPREPVKKAAKSAEGAAPDAPATAAPEKPSGSEAPAAPAAT